MWLTPSDSAAVCQLGHVTVGHQRRRAQAAGLASTFAGAIACLALAWAGVPAMWPVVVLIGATAGTSAFWSP